jgi:actin-like ATPase involved in cell morphogenesis/regulation of enolase protein 1 (concanavalin A-like superfamily)
MTYGLGVDLGTTWTAAAVRRGDAVEVLRLGGRRPEIPSVIFLPAEGPVIVGEAAVRRGEEQPDRLAREFKRRIGDPVPMRVGGSPYPAHALVARQLEHVLAVATATEQGPPGAVVLTCPANWGPFKRDLLEQAARMAETPRVVLRSEPEAAAISYAAGSHMADGDIVAVYDLGGGTFDAAVLHRTAAGFELLGTPEGIEQLGGIDFDEAVFEHVTGSLPADRLTGSDPDLVAALTRLRRDCVDAKETLSFDTEVMIPVALPGLHTRVRLTRREFEAMIAPALHETVRALDRALRSAGVGPDQLRAILLAGGSSRIPLAGALLGTEFGRPVVVDPDPEHSIALGAARLTAPAPAAAPPPSPSPQSPAPQSPAPQSPAPQSPAPQSPAPQSPAPQSPAPQSPAPQLPVPQSSAPGTPGPQAPAPQPSAPQGPAPQPSAPQGPAPQPSAPQGPAPQPSAPQGPAVGGSAAQGPAAQGPAVGGPVPQGPAVGGPVPQGPAVGGSAAGGPAPQGLAVGGSAAIGSAVEAATLPLAVGRAVPGAPDGSGRGGFLGRRRTSVLVAATAVLVVAVAVPFAVRAMRAGGEPAAQPSSSFSAAPSVPACGFAEDFDGAAVGGDWERTRADLPISVSGGVAELDAPDGADIYDTNLTAPMLLRPITGDFVLEAAVEASPAVFYQGAGLLLWNGPASYVRIERGFGNAGSVGFEYRNGGPHQWVHGTMPDQRPIRTTATKLVLRMTRTGGKITGAWRAADRAEFAELAAVQLKLPQTVKVGVSALNRAQNGAEPTPFHARFDRITVTC